MKRGLAEIDVELDSNVNTIRELAKSMTLAKICDFDLTEASLDTIPWTDLNYPGIYFIEIANCRRHETFKAWAEEFQNNWLDERYRRKFVANPKKSRIEKHSQLGEWIPLYIGKSKNISKRLREHIHLGLDKPTFALKLACRQHLHEDKFKLSCIRVDVRNYDLILPIVEKALRDKFNPIIGRQ